MADSNNIVEILLKFGLDKTKATEAAKELENIRKEVNKAGSDVEAYNKRLEQMSKLQEANKKSGGDMADTYADLRKKVEEANAAGQAEDETVKKKFVSYKDLKSAVKGLKEEFPGVAHAVKLAFNPITLTVAAIGGAIALYQTRVAQMTQSLGGIDMANVGETDIERINRFKSAWEGVAKAMAAAASQSSVIKKDFEASIKIIENNDKVAKAFGLDTGTTAAEEKRNLATAAADTLEASGRARIARAGTPGSAASEKLVSDGFDAILEKAVADKGEIKERIDWLLSLKDRGVLGRTLRAPKFITRYGYLNGMFSSDTGRDIESALEMERANLASQQGIIDAGKRFGLSSVSRGVRRGEIEAGKADIADAANMRGQAAGFSADVATGIATQAKSYGDSAASLMASSAPLAWIKGVTELAQGVQLMVQSQKELDKANKDLRALVNNNSRQQ